MNRLHPSLVIGPDENGDNRDRWYMTGFTVRTSPDMDLVLRRIQELAQILASNSQAISQVTATGMVRDIVLSEGLDDVPAAVLDVLARELRLQIAKRWKC
jgi:hypothetical protein